MWLGQIDVIKQVNNLIKRVNNLINHIIIQNFKWMKKIIRSIKQIKKNMSREEWS